MALSAAQIYSTARGAGFDADSAETMTAIAFAESGGNPAITNMKPPDGSIGLWQINMYGNLGPARRAQFGLSSNDDLKDPATNARAAYWIWQHQGYAAWGAYTNGSYRKYTSQASQARADVEGASLPSPLPPELDPTVTDSSIINGFIGPDAGDAMTPQTAVFLLVGAAALLALSLIKK